MARQMRLVGFLMTGPTYHHHGMWRHPETENRFLDPSWWEAIARVLENGKFDALFFADIASFYSDSVRERGGQMSLLDPLPLITLMSRVTSRIGLGVTLSTSFLPAFAIARILGSIDLISGGRLAWNIVTSFNHSEAQNHGQESLLPRNERYDRAEETLKTCMSLWSSWTGGALVMDKASGSFIDNSRIRTTEIKGKYTGSRGVFTVPPSPQGHPVIMQAGSSDRGRTFAASCAEMVFTLQHSLGDMQVFYNDMKARVKAAGRNPDHCSILACVDPIVGETNSIAREKQSFINARVDPALAIDHLSAHLGVDLTKVASDKPLADIYTEVEGARGAFDIVMQGTVAGDLTLAEAANRYATTAMCPQIVGRPESIADQLSEIFEAKGCDGFILTPSEMPGTYEAFTRSVVPLLQARGLFKTEYAGETLRHNLRQSN